MFGKKKEKYTIQHNLTRRGIPVVSERYEVEATSRDEAFRKVKKIREEEKRNHKTNVTNNKKRKKRKNNRPKSLWSYY